MTPEITRRLARLERDSPKTMSDDELIAALNSRNVSVRHLEALYTRVEVPFTAMIHLAAAWIRRDHGVANVMGALPWFPFMAIACLIAVDTASELPEEISRAARRSMEFEGLPLANQGGMIWISDVGSSLVTQLVRTRGGLQSIRDEVAGIHLDGTYDFVPVFTDDEASRLFRLVSPLEYGVSPPDLPVMVWSDPDGQLCSSHKSSRYPASGGERGSLDISGQTWTRRVRFLVGGP